MSAERSSFWPALWMAVVMFFAKASHWSMPELTPKRLGEYVTDLSVSVHADVLFCVLVGLLGQLALHVVRNRPRLSFLVYAVYFVFCLGSVIYAIASVQIFAFLRSPLTYALVYLADNMGTMSSSIVRGYAASLASRQARYAVSLDKSKGDVAIPRLIRVAACRVSQNHA